MSVDAPELEREIEEYEIHGPDIHRNGYLAGLKGLSVLHSPHPRGDWRDEIWCQAWREGHLEWLRINSRPELY
jgi:ribosome modulation factor